MSASTLMLPSPPVRPPRPRPLGQPPQEAFSLGRGLSISLVLHGLLVLPVFFLGYLEPAPRDNERLVVNLLGMIADRQTEQMTQGEKTNRPTPEARPANAAPQPAPMPRQSSAESPVRIKRQVETQERQPSQPFQPTATQGADEQHPQQTLQNTDSEMDELRRYMAAVRKAVKARIVYPAAAREAGQTGVPDVSFIIGQDGTIQPGSVRIRNSSGNPLLDESALQAVRTAAPFPPLPASRTSLPCNFQIPFVEDKKK